MQQNEPTPVNTDTPTLRLDINFSQNIDFDQMINALKIFIEGTLNKDLNQGSNKALASDFIASLIIAFPIIDPTFDIDMTDKIPSSIQKYLQLFADILPRFINSWQSFNKQLFLHNVFNALGSRQQLINSVYPPGF